MTDHPLRVAMRELTAQLQSDLALSATIAHNASIGAAREHVIHARLSQYLPSHLTMATGTAMNPAGERSRQLDVMIVDDTAGKPFVNVGGESVVPVELIHGCLQIKTSVTQSNVGDAVDNLASLLRLYRSLEQRPRDEQEADDLPFTAIVAYGGAKDKRELFEAFVEANLRLPRQEQTQCMLVLGQFMVHMSQRVGESGTDNPHGTYGPAPRAVADFWSTGSYAEDSTLAFYVVLSASLAAYRPPEFSPWAYTDTANLLPPGGLALYWRREGDPAELVRRREERKSS